MCELFALSARRPTSATFSLEEFAAQGRPGAPDVDGWGLAYGDGRDVRLYKEPEPAGASAWLSYILARSVDSRSVVSHIRHASRGGLSHANTQPFVREAGGRMHIFAHNGDLGDPAAAPLSVGGRFQPVGETDSEAAFCRLLELIAPLWSAGAGASPSVQARLDAVARFAAEMRALGEANFLYSDSELTFGHGHRRVGTGGDGAPACGGSSARRRSRETSCRKAASASVPTGRASLSPCSQACPSPTKPGRRSRTERS